MPSAMIRDRHLWLRSGAPYDSVRSAAEELRWDEIGEGEIKNNQTNDIHTHRETEGEAFLSELTKEIPCHCSFHRQKESFQAHHKRKKRPLCNKRNWFVETVQSSATSPLVGSLFGFSLFFAFLFFFPPLGILLPAGFRGPPGPCTASCHFKSPSRFLCLPLAVQVYIYCTFNLSIDMQNKLTCFDMSQ